MAPDSHIGLPRWPVKDTRSSCRGRRWGWRRRPRRQSGRLAAPRLAAHRVLPGGSPSRNRPPGHPGSGADLLPPPSLGQ